MTAIQCMSLIPFYIPIQPFVCPSVNDITSVTCFCGRLVNQIDLPPFKLAQLHIFTLFLFNLSFLQLLLTGKSRKLNQISEEKTQTTGRTNWHLIDWQLFVSFLTIRCQSEIAFDFIWRRRQMPHNCLENWLGNSGTSLDCLGAIFNTNHIQFTIFAATQRQKTERMLNRNWVKILPLGMWSEMAKMTTNRQRERQTV